MEGDSIGSWVKTLLSDAFYWTDNDLVVQTRSMYGGSPRARTASGSGASFVLDRGGKVSHFSYFANDRTCRRSPRADRRDRGRVRRHRAAVLGGEDASGMRAAQAVARSRGPAGGSGEAAGWRAGRAAGGVRHPGHPRLQPEARRQAHLARLSLLQRPEEARLGPGHAASVEPDGPIGSVYGDLIERLADTHEVIPFAYDWRRPVEDEARRLAEAVDVALVARAGSQQPVRILAHSMGGLVARTMALEKPETWQRLMAREGARFLMLGTPNGGSWSPMQTLSGDDTFGNALAVFGSIFDNGGAREVMAGMPGFIQLQADLLDTTLRLDRAESWQKLADDDMRRLAERSIWHSDTVQQAIYRWGAPPQAVLDQSVALRRRLDAQAAGPGLGHRQDAARGRPRRLHARPASSSAKPASSTSTRPAAATAGCRWPRRSCPACGPGPSMPRTATCRARRAPSLPTWSSSSMATRTCSTASIPRRRGFARRARPHRALPPLRAWRAAGPRAGCSRRCRRRMRATCSPSPGGPCSPPVGPARRAGPCTCRCSTPT
jgi:hypothetical protein